MNSLDLNYPLELLAARRVAFVDEIAQQKDVDIINRPSSPGRESAASLQRLKSFAANYSPKLLTTKLLAFINRVGQRSNAGFSEVWHSVIQNNFFHKTGTPTTPMTRAIRISFIVAGFLIAVYLGSLIYGNTAQLKEVVNSVSPQNAISHTILNSASGSGELAAATACGPDSSPSFCLAKGFDRQGSNWISNSADSWIRMDLNQSTLINSVEFSMEKASPFTIAVALSDTTSADNASSLGNSSYIKVFDSQQDSISASTSVPGGIKASFEPVEARFVKITFANLGTAINQVKVFSLNPYPRSTNTFSITKLTSTPTAGMTAKPTDTTLPTYTSQPFATPTAIPTDTPLPTDTPTFVPTDTPLPPDTATIAPTDTPLPTDTPVIAPTEIPLPTNTPAIAPTDIPLPTDNPTVEIPTDAPTSMSTSGSSSQDQPPTDAP
ncbi:MAG: hypothetical protein WBW94_04215 [Anaerolineales bacterium]